MVYETRPGSPFPLGASFCNGIWNFAIYATKQIHALHIGDYTSGHITATYPLSPNIHTSGDIWHIAIACEEQRIAWGWSSDEHLIIDPYAHLLRTGNTWGNNAWQHAQTELLSVAHNEPAFQWKHVYKGPYIPSPLIIYEAHVRGFTKHSSSDSVSPGSFRAMIDKLPHLKKLGITALELQPIQEYNESEWPHTNPISGERLFNYWGYSPLHFFSPMQRYGTTSDPITTSNELKELVDSCHSMGIAVIMDVVYNHTGEGNEKGPSYSLKHTALSTYYLQTNTGEYSNYSGCGNTVRINHPVTASLMIDSLRHFVLEYHIDGFRFDLASILTRDINGSPQEISYCLESLIHDPILSKTILIAEPWDAVGLYQTGKFFALNQQKRPKFLEWNDHFRDDIRAFLQGKPGASRNFATRICGSMDLYALGSANNSINFISSHDGFSLYDMVSYATKHNEENGQNNIDGSSSASWNCGHEGPTQDIAIRNTRKKHVLHGLMALFLAQGIPMLTMGDEALHSKQGNNNSWCHDSPINWLSWNDITDNHIITEWISMLIAIRRSTDAFTINRFWNPHDIAWIGINGNTPSWEDTNQVVAWQCYNAQEEPELIAIFNMSDTDQIIKLPPPKWLCHLDSSHLQYIKHPVIYKTSVEVTRFSALLLTRINDR